MLDRREMRMLFVGDDWAEAHHDIEIINDAGIEALHALIADRLGADDDAGDVVIGIETDRGPWVQALIATGYQVFAINPVQVARYRERHSPSGGKSDRRGRARPSGGRPSGP